MRVGDITQVVECLLSMQGVLGFPQHCMRLGLVVHNWTLITWRMETRGPEEVQRSYAYMEAMRTD